MKRSIKTTILSCLAGLATLALALGFVFVNRNVSSNLSTDGNATLQGDYGKNTSALMNAVDGETVDVYGGATYTAFDTMSKISTDGNYLLIVVGIDDVSAYDALGMSIKKDGVEQVTTDNFDGKTYYDSISYTDGSTQTLVDIFGETGTPEGMLVFEVAYDVNVAYRVTPSFTKTDDTTVYAQMKVNKTYEVTADTATCTEDGVKTYTFGNDSYQVASVAKGHTYTYTANEATVGTQTMTIACACGDSQTVSPDAYHNITRADAVGANTHFYDTGMNKGRTAIDMKEHASASDTVKKATVLAVNQDYTTNFYGGLGMRFYVYAETAGTATAIFKAASGYITNVVNWSEYTTADMQFNKVFSASVNGNKVAVDDSVTLKGTSGTYAVLANWTYVPLRLDLQAGINEVVITSLQPLNEGYTQEGDGIYKDGVKITTWEELKPAFVYSDNGDNGTQSSPNVDSIAFYGDDMKVVTIKEDKLSYDSNGHFYDCTCGQTDCSGEIARAEHTFDQEVVLETTLAETATCTTAARYYKSCICGAHGTETFAYGAFAAHNYTSQSGDGQHWLECSVCHDKTNYSTDHIYQAVSATETWTRDDNGYVNGGTQTLHLECACGETTTKTLDMNSANYKDITSDMLTGKNDQVWIQGNYLTTDNRTTAIIRNSGSATVAEALKLSYGGGYATQFYGDKDATGGAGFTVDLGVTQDTTGAVVIKASAAHLLKVDWANKASQTGDMQFNKIFAVSILHEDGSSTAVNIADDVVLKGTTGNYAVMANWNYVTLSNLALKAGDKLSVVSMSQFTDDGQNFLYWDGKAANTISVNTTTTGDTQSSVSVDTVAVYLG